MRTFHHISGYYEESYSEEHYEENEAIGLAPLPDGKVKCLKCGKILSKMGNAKRHYAFTHQPNKPAKCHICQAVFKNAEYRDNHQRNNHGVTPSMIRNAVPPPPVNR